MKTKTEKQTVLVVRIPPRLKASLGRDRKRFPVITGLGVDSHVAQLLLRH